MGLGSMYTRYPSSSVVLYDGLTSVHFLLGGAALLLGYQFPIGLPLAAAYVVLAFTEMFVLMPLTVCPSCIYTRLEGSLCVSGMNRWSRRIARPREVARFGDRAKGTFCPNNLYLASLGFPVVAVIPGMALRFWCRFEEPWFVLVALLLFRFFVVFPRIACINCRAKNVCPNAQAMGLSGQ
ncbi:MAG: hypothetical protein M1274_03050 [Actinobacteria bacterium]|nr:hypothetical protein [Actinomycetota bacterium]